MTKFLIKVFIKDYNNFKSAVVRQKYGKLASFVGIISNVFLFLIKVVLGLFTNSITIIADSFNNLSDSLSSIITLIGFKLAAKPADKEHPFGHGRIEYISGLVVSFIIILIGVEFLKTSVKKIFYPEDIIFSYITLSILIISILIKLWQSYFNKKIGNIINSQSLIGISIDSKNDAIITLTTIFSICIYKFFNLNLDGYFGLVVSIFICYSGISLAKETLSTLLGESIDEELEEKIKAISMEHELVIGVHDILVHNYGPNTSIASLHVEVPSDICINEAHNIVDKIEKQVEKELSIFLTIHLDPVNLKDERIKILKKEIKNIFIEYNSEIHSHDHRVIEADGFVNFVFDLVLPYDFSKEDENSLISSIKNRVSSINKNYKCIINIQKSFIKK